MQELTIPTLSDLEERNPVLALVEENKSKNRAQLVALEGFQKILSKEPSHILSLPHNSKIKYVPISHVQMLLDRLYFGQWQTKNFVTNVVGNEVIGTIELWVLHPITQQWNCKIGTAAVMIRQNKGARLSDIDQKIKNAMVQDAPHLLSNCIKNAAKWLGAIFGRDLNREFVDQYQPLVSPAVAKESYSVEQVRSEVETLTSTTDVYTYFNSNKSFKQDKEIRAIFDARIANLETSSK